MTTIHIQNLTVNVSEAFPALPVLLGTLSLSSDKAVAANAEPAPRYVPSADGTTVTDTKTGLMWSQDKVGGKGNFDKAEKAVAECRLGGFDDWRMPTREELESILDLSRSDPAVDPVFACESSWYWTSTPYASSPDCAWIVLFHYGNVNSYHRDDYNAFVRAVRAASPAGQ